MRGNLKAEGRRLLPFLPEILEYYHLDALQPHETPGEQRLVAQELWSTHVSGFLVSNKKIRKDID